MIWALSSYRSYELEKYLLKDNWNYHNLPSEEHGVLVKKPGGQTTKLPLSTDVRPWPGDIFFVSLCLLYPQMYRPGLKVISLHLRKVDDVPEDGQHVLLRDHLDKGGQVEERRELGGATSKIELIGTRLVEVPRNVDVNCVQACSLVDIVGIIYKF